MARRIYERLQAALDSGLVHIDGHDFVGTAVDGTEVTIGDTNNPAAAERYLARHPSPEHW